MRSMNGNRVNLYDFANTRKLDTLSIVNFKMPELQLMGQAALSSFYSLLYRNELPSPDGPGRIIIIAGSGNNGGDGMALAYHILCYNTKYRNIIHLFRTEESKSESSNYYAAALEDSGVKIKVAEPENLPETLTDKDVIIDCMLGTGQRGSPREPIHSLLIKINNWRMVDSPPRLISLDLPTGLNESDPVVFTPPGETGQYPAPDEIHCYGVDRLAIRLNTSLSMYAKTYILPMGFHPLAIKECNSIIERAPEYPSLNRFIKEGDDHKYSAGHGIVMGGSAGMEGAALMCSSAFFASGGGICHTWSPSVFKGTPLVNSSPSTMFLPSPESLLDTKFPAAIAAGVGLSAKDNALARNHFFSYLNLIESKKEDLPFIILDAGALQWILDDEYKIDWKKKTLITPHSGEWIRLGGRPIHSTDSFFESENHAVSLGCSVLVKDAISSLFTQGEIEMRDIVFSNPTPSLATAGSGDSLTGILLAALSRRRNTDDPEMTLSTIIDAVLLHQKAAELRIHPAAEQIPALIRETLGGKDELI